jgi:hypothetical protein
VYVRLGCVLESYTRAGYCESSHTKGSLFLSDHVSFYHTCSVIVTYVCKCLRSWVYLRVWCKCVVSDGLEVLARGPGWPGTFVSCYPAVLTESTQQNNMLSVEMLECVWKNIGSCMRCYALVWSSFYMHAISWVLLARNTIRFLPGSSLQQRCKYGRDSQLIGALWVCQTLVCCLGFVWRRIVQCSTSMIPWVYAMMQWKITDLYVCKWSCCQ